MKMRKLTITIFKISSDLKDFRNYRYSKDSKLIDIRDFVKAYEEFQDSQQFQGLLRL